MNLREKLFKLPEGYFLIICLLAAYTPPFTFNWLFLSCALLVLLQFVIQKVWLGLSLSSISLLLCLFMLAALISELSEFKELSGKALEMLFVGASIWLLNMFFTGLLFYKNSKRMQNSPNFQRK